MTPEERAGRLAEVRAQRRRAMTVRASWALAEAVRGGGEAPSFVLSYVLGEPAIVRPMRRQLRRAIESWELGEPGARERAARLLEVAAGWLEAVPS